MSNSEERIIETFFEDDDLKVTVELYDDILFAHVDVKTYSKQVLKKLKDVWEYGKYVAWLSGFDHVHSYTENTRFAKFLGEYVALGEVDIPPYSEGRKLEVVQWEL